MFTYATFIDATMSMILWSETIKSNKIDRRVLPLRNRVLTVHLYFIRIRDAEMKDIYYKSIWMSLPYDDYLIRLYFFHSTYITFT